MTTGEAQLVAASGVLCGTLLALFGYLFRAHVVHNPGQVPFADWMGRDVALGCLSFVSIWGPVAAVVVFLSLGTLGLFEPTATDPNDLGWPRVFMPSLGVALGLPWSFQFAKSRWAASWPSGLAQIAQRTDESTTLHFRSCISRTLGRLSAELLRGPHGGGVDRVFERHLDDMIRERAAVLPTRERTRALGLIYLRLPMQKMRYLLAFLGFESVRDELASTHQDRLAMASGDQQQDRTRAFPDWPLGQPSRLTEGDERRAEGLKDQLEQPHRRRRTDLAEYRAELLGLRLSS